MLGFAKKAAARLFGQKKETPEVMHFIMSNKAKRAGATTVIHRLADGSEVEFIATKKTKEGEPLSVRDVLSWDDAHVVKTVPAGSHTFIRYGNGSLGMHDGKWVCDTSGGRAIKIPASG